MSSVVGYEPLASTDAAQPRTLRGLDMSAHERLGACAVPRFKRVQNKRVLRNRLPGPIRLDQGGRAEDEHRLLKHVRSLHEEAVLGCIKEREMELAVQLISI